MKFHPSHALFGLILGMGLLYPNEMTTALHDAGRWFEHSFGWLVLLICTFFIGFCIYIAFGRFGHIRLGGEDATPQFSTMSWLAMLFAAGMGSGLIFYGAAEPLLHLMQPPPSMDIIGESAEQARRAMAISYFHWGIHAWAIYAVAALSVAYFTFYRHSNLLPSSPITNNPFLKATIDSLAVLAVVFGIVASLTQGILQVGNGVIDQFGLSQDPVNVHLVLLCLLFVCYMGSACTGIGRGIKILSNINMVIAIALLLFILSFGPTQFIMNSFVSGIGDYLDQFISLSFNTRHISDTDGWTGKWTITYLLWWVAWAPFVGVFIARISRGRTLKGFLLGVILVPTVFSALWFATLGGTGIYLELVDQPGFAAVISHPESTTYALLRTLPIPEITSITVIFLLFIFLVTSADSGTYVLGMFTSNGTLSPPVRQRLLWGVIVALLTAGVMMNGGTFTFFRSLIVVGAIPYLFIMMWQAIALLRALRQDAKGAEKS